MDEVKRMVSNLVQMLDRGQKEVKTLVEPMHQLQSYLEEAIKTAIQESLDRLLSRIRAEAANITWGSVVVLVSPEGRVTVGKTYTDEDSDPWLKRLKSQDFCVLRLPEFSYFIHQLTTQVTEGNWMPVIEFLKANTKFESPLLYSVAPAAKEAQQRGDPSAPSEWKLPGWLPAFPWEGPPLPRRLFKD